jgi:GT2 family glycosyltransferase
MFKISVSIVLYKNKQREVESLIDCLNKTSPSLLVLFIDNSPTKNKFNLSTHHTIDYFHLPHNPGFGSGHNLGIKRSIELGYDFHYIINPDVLFDFDLTMGPADYIIENPDVGIIMPELRNSDGSIQYLPKRLPYPWYVLLRSMIISLPLKSSSNVFLRFYELRDIERDKIYRTPLISGAFALLNLNAIKVVGGFDENYFMYFEDWDLSRRINLKFKSIYYPKIHVFHEHKAEARRKMYFFLVFIKSFIYYFKKWGWLIDKQREYHSEALKNSLYLRQ